MPKEWLGWHFLPADGKLRYDDGRKPRVGRTLKVKGPLEMCRNGLHASKSALDALDFAPGPIVCRVRLSGAILHRSDKSCASERTILAKADVTKQLREFTVWCAKRAGMEVPWLPAGAAASASHAASHARLNSGIDLTRRAEEKAQYRKLTAMLKKALGLK